MDTSSLIESILFYKGEPTTIKELARILGKKSNEIETALNTLRGSLKDRGIVLLSSNDTVMIGTNPLASALIEGLIKEDLHKDLGKAGLETLAIIMYLGPASRSDIDYIRGVNSTFILRNLMIRGLVERTESTGERRGFSYQGTMELLSYLGLTSFDKLPEYEKVKKEYILRKEEKEANEKLELQKISKEESD